MIINLFLEIAFMLFDLLRGIVYAVLVLTGVLVLSAYWYILTASGAPFGIDAQVLLGDWHVWVFLGSLFLTGATLMRLSGEIE